MNLSKSYKSVYYFVSLVLSYAISAFQAEGLKQRRPGRRPGI
jgi:hypothetical protein